MREHPIDPDTLMRTGRAPRRAVVLAGGGARGAYEAGVLSYILSELPAHLEHPPRFDIVCGTSVGAVHAAFVAAAACEGPSAGARLRRIWESLTLDSVFRVGLRDILAMPSRLLGLSRPASREGSDPALERIPGLLDTGPLERIVLHEIGWETLRRNIHRGVVDSLCIAATEIATGRSVVFVDNRHRRVDSWARDPFVVARPAQIGPQHALASAAIPLLFPAVRIDDGFFCDGGLRLNTPLSPALRLGADRVLVISLRHRATPQEEREVAGARVEGYSSPAYLIGKVLNALLIDRIEYDLDRTRMFNAVMAGGAEAYGGDFLAKINRIIVEKRGAPFRVVDTAVIAPSRDLGRLAADQARVLERAPTGSRAAKALLRALIRRMPPGEADLLSYVLFDRGYAHELLELGRRDAEASRDALVRFFED